MRLASVEAIPYALPFREPYVTARGTLTRREMVLLRLRAEEGLEGLGEAVPLSLRGGATLARVTRELEALGELAGEAPAGLEAGAAAAELSAPARCAVETALWDLRARAGGATTQPAAVECNATLVAGEPAAVAAEARRWQEAGFTTFKLKLGAGQDVAQVRAVREALGEEARIRVDANAAWSLAAARETLAAIEPFGIELVEQPVERIEEAAELAAATGIPLAGDESIVTAADARRAAELGAFAVTGIKLSKVGGQATALAIAEELAAYASSALDGPVGIAAGARLAAALDARAAAGLQPRIAHGLATQRLFAATIASVQCEVRDGWLHPPPGPGLGVEIDEDALAAHRI
ncbi:MAG: mandelate racemase/muconate lactonizing enzyme family protein [Solirubrobacterales bacterium]